jgi:hypothetical protein
VVFKQTVEVRIEGIMILPPGKIGDWVTQDFLRAESKFRRVEGHRAMATLPKALEVSAQAGPTGTGRGVA